MIEEIFERMFSTQGALGILVLCTVLFFVKKIHNSREIAKLGARAPEIPAKLPVGKEALTVCIVYEIQPIC
jgi:hypothetical protein